MQERYFFYVMKEAIYSQQVIFFTKTKSFWILEKKILNHYVNFLIVRIKTALFWFAKENLNIVQFPSIFINVCFGWLGG